VFARGSGCPWEGWLIVTRPTMPRGVRQRDRTGEPCGPYVVTRPVGANPLASEHWHVGCPLCGHEPKPVEGSALPTNHRKVKRCPGCGRKNPILCQ
jgi:hypothetical protein